MVKQLAAAASRKDRNGVLLWAEMARFHEVTPFVVAGGVTALLSAYGALPPDACVARTVLLVLEAVCLKIDNNESRAALESGIATDCGVRRCDAANHYPIFTGEHMRAVCACVTAHSNNARVIIAACSLAQQIELNGCYPCRYNADDEDDDDEEDGGSDEEEGSEDDEGDDLENDEDTADGASSDAGAASAVAAAPAAAAIAATTTTTIATTSAAAAADDFGVAKLEANANAAADVSDSNNENPPMTAAKMMTTTMMDTAKRQTSFSRDSFAVRSSAPRIRSPSPRGCALCWGLCSAEGHTRIVRLIAALAGRCCF